MHQSQIDNNFMYHAPTPSSLDKYTQLRSEGKALAETINALVPESREQSLAITKLEEVIMWANAGVARHGR